MALRVSFELDEIDLQHFRLIMREARKTLARMPPEDIVAAADSQLQVSAQSATPGFIVERIAKLRLLMRMLTDLEWRLPHDDAKRVLNALAYFTEPDDLIPDHIPGVGFLDDAIMVELVVRELRPEIEAYQDFCALRDESKGNRNAWLARRRGELQRRMRRRKDRSRSVSPIGLFD